MPRIRALKILFPEYTIPARSMKNMSVIISQMSLKEDF